jgi:hypothetical protein
MLKAIMAEPWGKQNLEAMKEQGYQLDAREKYGNAAQHWNGLMKTLQGRINTDAAAKDQYFEIYVNLVRSYYKYGMSLSDETKRQHYVKGAATFITRLEEAWPDLGGEVSKARFTLLLNQEPTLKKEYEQQKAANR